MKQGYLLPPPIDETGISPTSAGWNRCSLVLCGWRWDNSRPALQVEGMPPKTCSNLFNLDLTVQGPPPPGKFKLVHYEECTVDKLAVGLLLKCFLVFFSNWQYSTPAATNWKRNGRWKNVLLKTSHLLLYCVFTHRCVIQFCTTFWLENPLYEHACCYCTLRYSLRVTFANSISTVCEKDVVKYAVGDRSKVIRTLKSNCLSHTKN